MASKFRLNRYNWFGQKLLVQHEYGEIIRLRQYLVNSLDAAAAAAAAAAVGQEDGDATILYRRQTSDHFSYIHGLALMKTSSHLDEIIFSLQRLNFDKNNQYFLLLCNCLLYSGNYDSVVALCKQVINKEIDSIQGLTGGSGNGSFANKQLENLSLDDQLADELLVDICSSDLSKQQKIDRDSINEKRRNSSMVGGGLNLIVQQESFEFKKIFNNINRNHLINEPRLWFTFGLCLEYQRQFKDAHFAFRVAVKLTSGDGKTVGGANSSSSSSSSRQATNFDLSSAPKEAQLDYSVSNDSDLTGKVCMSNYYLPHIKFAEFCIKNKCDFKAALQVLANGRQLCPQDYTLNSKLALCLSGQPNVNQANFDTAMEIISRLEAHTITNRNPSSGYNRLAIKCMRKLGQTWDGSSVLQSVLQTFFQGTTAGDEDRLNSTYLLAKAYVVINSLVHEQVAATTSAAAAGDENLATNNYNYKLTNQIDKLIETLRNSDPMCRVSASLWNNLGLCYLIKRRFIACFSCLSKANQISPLDWRINYNLAAACVHVGLFSKALVCLLAAKSLYSASTTSQLKSTSTSMKKKNPNQSHPLITSLLAICYEKLDEVNESRRLHIESIRPNRGSSSSSSGSGLSNMPIISLINYLIFLHKNSDQSDEQHVKLKLHLLDQLEHCWLQRSQNDPQFSCHILETAQLIGQETMALQSGQAIRKSYAWTKSVSGLDETQIIS